MFKFKKPTEYKVIDQYQRWEFEEKLNEAAKEGWKLIHFNSIFARLGTDHQDHHTQFHAVMKRKKKNE